jgi:hypothetical protein
MSKIALAATALAAAAALSTLTPAAAQAAPAPQASTGCLRTVGQVQQLWANAASGWDGHIADFYQGYDQCAHQAYAEIHFWNTRVPGSAAGSTNYIAIENAEWIQGGWNTDGHGSWNTNDPWDWGNNPGYPYWWDSGKISIYGQESEVVKASYDFTFDAPDGTHHCSGQSWWNYSNGSVPVSPSGGCNY